MYLSEFRHGVCWYEFIFVEACDEAEDLWFVLGEALLFLPQYMGPEYLGLLKHKHNHFI